MAKRSKKTYVLRNASGDTDRVFTGSSPRQAALKAATRGVSKIMLRERGRRNADKTYSVHVFSGSVKTVAAPENRPSWLPARVRKPIVRKQKVLRLKSI